MRHLVRLRIFPKNKNETTVIPLSINVMNGDFLSLVYVIQQWDIGVGDFNYVSTPLYISLIDLPLKMGL